MTVLSSLRRSRSLAAIGGSARRPSVRRSTTPKKESSRNSECLNRGKWQPYAKSGAKYEAPYVHIPEGTKLHEVQCPQGKAWHSSSDRYSLNELLGKFAEAIHAIARELDELIKSHPQDDPLEVDHIFLLRYLLSYQDTVKACSAAKKCLEYRRTEWYLKLAQDVARPGFNPGLTSKEMEAINKDIHPMLTRTVMGDVVEYILPAGTPTFWDSMPAFAKVFKSIDMGNKESLFQYLDFESRRRGYIVKTYTVIDYKCVKSMTSFVWKGLQTGLGKKMGETSELSNFLHPLLLEKSWICNCPTASWILSLCKAVFPEKTMQKIGVMDVAPHDVIDGIGVHDALGTMNAAAGDTFTIFKSFRDVDFI